MRIQNYFLVLFSFSLLSFLSCNKDCNNNIGSCQLDPDSGLCEAAIIKFYYDEDENKCSEFIYGGCDGIVPFDSLEECLICECH